MYNINDFITVGQIGGPIAIYALPTVTATVWVADRPINIDTTSYDLGQYFTAQQVLESYDIRAGIISGQLVATIGATSLSMTPVI